MKTTVITKLALERGESRRSLAIRAGVHPDTLYKPSRTIHPSTAYLIADALEVKITDIAEVRGNYLWTLYEN